MDKRWINVAKGISIIGVVLQHVRGYLYTNDYIFYSVWFVVAMFVMVGGYNVFSSYINRGTVIVKRRLLVLFFDYLLATIFYTIYKEHFLDIEIILHHLVRFDASGPLYYVAVYMQLVLVTPILIGVLNWCKGEYKVIRFFTIAISIFIVCYFSVHYTNIFDIAIGGGCLFAAPWLLFWFLGMAIRKVDLCIYNGKKKLIKSMGLSVLLLGWQHYFVNLGYNLKLKPIFAGQKVGMTWANALETIILFFLINAVVCISEEKNCKISEFCFTMLGILGRHTLYIFLYHMLFLDFYMTYLKIDSIWLNRCYCLLFIIGGPIVLEYIINLIKGWMKNIMREVRVDV